MRNWRTYEDLAFLGLAMSLLKDGSVLEPDALGVPTPVDLQGMKFPTVVQCKDLDLSTATIDRISGHQEFDNSKLRHVDLSKARLSFSVWNNCRFENVCFDEAKLNQVRFFGCTFSKCSFRCTDLRDASFSVGRNGAETEMLSTTFDRADFRGASCSNPVIRSTSFLNCTLDGFVFDGALCEAVTFVGNYHELTFRGIPNADERNRLYADLSSARIVWLNADFGVDLRAITLPKDGSCLIVKDRLRAVGTLCSRLSKEAGRVGTLVAKVLSGLYSERAMSPLERTQDTILLSKAMIADFAEVDDADLVNSIFALIRSISQSEGFLAAS